jgi:hypothetical protein
MLLVYDFSCIAVLPRDHDMKNIAKYILAPVSVFSACGVLSVALLAASPCLAQATGTTVSWVLVPAPAQKTITDHTCSGCVMGKIEARKGEAGMIYSVHIRKPDKTSIALEVDSLGRTLEGGDAAPVSPSESSMLTQKDYDYLKTLGVDRNGPALSKASDSQRRMLHFLINQGDKTPDEKETAVRAALKNI